MRHDATPGAPTQATATGSSAPPPTARAEYVGGKACAECHAKAYAAWHGSRHDLAMQVADDKSVLGNFGNAKFTYAGVTSTFFKRDGAFFVNTDGPDGKLADYAIKYTFGVHPLQQYLIEFPGGRLQALSIAWDSRTKTEGGQRWFHLYPGQNIKAGDALHWTRPSQNWNFMCAECHSTNLHKNFNAETGEFKTTWSELDVSCEACHGPGSRHVAWAKSKPDGKGYSAADMGLALALDERKGVTWSPVAATGNAQRSVPRTTRARSRDVRALPRPCEPHLRRLRPRQAAARYAPALAARRRPLLERRADARRGLQLGLVRAEPDVREGRHLLRLPRSAHAGGQGPGQRRVRAVPSERQVRRAGAYASRQGDARRIVPGLPHADDDVHGRRSAARPFAADPAARPVGEARHAQCLQQLPHQEDGTVGGGRDRQVDGEDAGRLPEFRRRARCRLGRGAGRARRAAGIDRRSGATGDRPRQRPQSPWPLADAGDARIRRAGAERSGSRRPAGRGRGDRECRAAGAGALPVADDVRSRARGAHRGGARARRPGRGRHRRRRSPRVRQGAR